MGETVDQHRRRLLTVTAITMAACVLCIAALIVFSPKERVVGGLRGGPIGPGESEYREDYQCLGIASEFCPDWPDYGCDYLCYGLVYDRECSFETLESGGVTREPTACR
jgi:hypothetical protein